MVRKYRVLGLEPLVQGKQVLGQRLGPPVVSHPQESKGYHPHVKG